MRFLVTLAVVLLLATGARAAEREDLIVETAGQLRSSDPAQRAWGAYRVGGTRRQEQITRVR